jgi:hypothetical protein
VPLGLRPLKSYNNPLPLGSWRKQPLRLNTEALLGYQTRSTPYLLGARSWTRPHGIYRSRREFGTRTHCAKNIDGSTIATAAATGIDTRSIAAWDDAFAFTFTAGCKATALTGRALRVFLAAHDLMGPSAIRAASRCRLRVGIAARHAEPREIPVVQEMVGAS